MPKRTEPPTNPKFKTIGFDMAGYVPTVIAFSAPALLAQLKSISPVDAMNFVRGLKECLIRDQAFEPAGLLRETEKHFTYLAVTTKKDC